MKNRHRSPFAKFAPDTPEKSLPKWLIKNGDGKEYIVYASTKRGALFVFSAEVLRSGIEKAQSCERLYFESTWSNVVDKRGTPGA